MLYIITNQQFFRQLNSYHESAYYFLLHHALVQLRQDCEEKREYVTEVTYQFSACAPSGASSGWAGGIKFKSRHWKIVSRHHDHGTWHTLTAVTAVTAVTASRSRQSRQMP